MISSPGSSPASLIRSLALSVPLFLSISLPSVAEAAETRRFALVAGANFGGADRPTLRWADEDAGQVARVLSEYGGVRKSDEVLLLEPKRADLERALADLSRRVGAAQAQGQRTELLVYYSGHSDEQGLLLGGNRYEYGALRTQISAVPADVRVVILDSCSSGSITRTKGGTARPAFLADESVDVTGSAYLTSSAPDEAAQESDRLNGSFFTHFLVSGLRGAADTSSDGRVTLNEAYQFAYDETLSRTKITRAGAQHPAFDIRMAGTGDLVMTELSASSAILMVDEGIEGRLFVSDDKGKVVAELYKPAGRPVSLGLGAGTYTLLIEAPDRSRREGTFTLVEGQSVNFNAISMHAVSAEKTTVRGGEAYVDVPFSMGIVPELAWPPGDRPTKQHVALSLGLNSAAALDGVQAALVGNLVRDDVRGAQVGVAFNSAGSVSRGLQFAQGVVVSGAGVNGAQVAVGASVAKGAVHGAQVSVGASIAGADVSGVQLAVGVNAAPSVHGAQVGSGLSMTKELEGAQVSLVNVAEQAKGLQLGLVNVGKRVDGTQVGLINVAKEMDGEPVGLISIIGDGYHHLEVYAADEPVNIGGVLGGKHLYNVLGVGWLPGDRSRLTSTLGMGWHAGDRFFVDTDLAAMSAFVFPSDGEDVDWESAPFSTRLRVVAGYEIKPNLAIFVGPTLSASFIPGEGVQGEGGRAGEYPTLFRIQSLEMGDYTLPIWPGLTAGLRI